ncbi:hypothetical protein FIBSPDRAFT_855653 [Athelia psychrophila]|uniref:Uncharacterized protein n=1 Tax=Athelia psychrophila TaxID=1759441 RepID=A0A166P643_9AGAM|nr:hypothetical protein FIBSPDRAFT_855653 [Fibularhizoctonia sp. CBS 109695]
MCDLALRTTIDQPGCTGTAWGFAKENPRVFVLLAGWDVIKSRNRFTNTEAYGVSTLPFKQGITVSEVTAYEFKQR